MSIQEVPHPLRPQARQPFPWRVLLIGVGLLLVLLLAGVVRSLARFADEDARLQAFAPHVDAWLDAAQAAAPPGPPADGAPHAPDVPPEVRGGLVVLHAPTRSVWPWAQGRLQDGLGAATPDDVGTAAVCHIRWRHVGTYEEVDTGAFGGEAWRGSVRVTLLDVVRGEVLAVADFEGREPVTSKQRAGDETGGLPMWEVLAWLQGLPRR